jgi:hypothetical protein
MYKSSIIVTHQSRLRCFLNQFLINGDNGVARFQNGAILKVTIDRAGLEILLIHNGEIDEKKPDYVYYVTPGSKLPAGAVYQIRPFRPIKSRNHQYQYYTERGDGFIFYLIRHGQATHNVKRGLSKKLGSAVGQKDTGLTTAGVNQAIKSGRAMKNIIDNVDFLFASDLKRTRQTMIKFLEGTLLDNNKPIIVLPCAHELSYVKGTMCDGKQKLTASENKMDCPYNLTANPLCLVSGSHSVKWDYYHHFYNGTRSNPGKNRSHCRDTDFIIQALDIIKGETKEERIRNFSTEQLRDYCNGMGFSCRNNDGSYLSDAQILRLVLP